MARNDCRVLLIMKFIVDANVGKLARWLRLLGHDAVFFEGKDDGEMVAAALADERVILTRDTHLMEWGVIRSGRVKAVLIQEDDPAAQIRQVVRDLNLGSQPRPFTICLECNSLLLEIAKADVKERVPPYVFKTQEQFMECPKCHRVYWRGTHWQAMLEKLARLTGG